jgi:DNA-binding transcriptional MerR regulator
MLIGELAERAGTSARTLRDYEAHGLVRAERNPNGYRRYDEAELRVVS